MEKPEEVIQMLLGAAEDTYLNGDEMWTGTGKKGLNEEVGCFRTTC